MSTPEIRIRATAHELHAIMRGGPDGYDRRDRAQVETSIEVLEYEIEILAAELRTQRVGMMVNEWGIRVATLRQLHEAATRLYTELWQCM